jgi:hypothetical protein
MLIIRFRALPDETVVPESRDLAVFQVCLVLREKRVNLHMLAHSPLVKRVNLVWMV